MPGEVQRHNNYNYCTSIKMEQWIRMDSNLDKGHPNHLTPGWNLKECIVIIPTTHTHTHARTHARTPPPPPPPPPPPTHTHTQSTYVHYFWI